MNANEVFEIYREKLNTFTSIDDKFDALIEAYDMLSDDYTAEEKRAIYHEIMLME